MISAIQHVGKIVLLGADGGCCSGDFGVVVGGPWKSQPGQLCWAHRYIAATHQEAAKLAAALSQQQHVLLMHRDGSSEALHFTDNL